MDRQPTRIHPQSGIDAPRIVTFRDGPQLLPEAFKGMADEEEYPDLTFQDWIGQVANRKIEARVVGAAMKMARTGHAG